MTESEIRGLGFQLEEQYNHDEFNTNRYLKGVLEVEFTYEGDKLLTIELSISEVNCKPVTLEVMKIITPILGTWFD